MSQTQGSLARSSITSEESDSTLIIDDLRQLSTTDLDNSSDERQKIQLLTKNNEKCIIQTTGKIKASPVREKINVHRQKSFPLDDVVKPDHPLFRQLLGNFDNLRHSSRGVNKSLSEIRGPSVHEAAGFQNEVRSDADGLRDDDLAIRQFLKNSVSQIVFNGESQFVNDTKRRLGQILNSISDLEEKEKEKCSAKGPLVFDESLNCELVNAKNSCSKAYQKLPYNQSHGETSKFLRDAKERLEQLQKLNTLNGPNFQKDKPADVNLRNSNFTKYNVTKKSRYTFPLVNRKHEQQHGHSECFPERILKNTVEEKRYLCCNHQNRSVLPNESHRASSYDRIIPRDPSRLVEHDSYYTASETTQSHVGSHLPRQSSSLSAVRSSGSGSVCNRYVEHHSKFRNCYPSPVLTTCRSSSLVEAAENKFPPGALELHGSTYLFPAFHPTRQNGRVMKKMNTLKKEPLQPISTSKPLKSSLIEQQSIKRDALHRLHKYQSCAEETPVKISRHQNVEYTRDCKDRNGLNLDMVAKDIAQQRSQIDKIQCHIDKINKEIAFVEEYYPKEYVWDKSDARKNHVCSDRFVQTHLHHIEADLQKLDEVSKQGDALLGIDIYKNNVEDESSKNKSLKNVHFLNPMKPSVIPDTTPDYVHKTAVYNTDGNVQYSNVDNNLLSPVDNPPYESILHRTKITKDNPIYRNENNDACKSFRGLAYMKNEMPHSFLDQPNKLMPMEHANADHFVSPAMITEQSRKCQKLYGSHLPLEARSELKIVPCDGEVDQTIVKSVCHDGTAVKPLDNADLITLKAVKEEFLVREPEEDNNEKIGKTSYRRKLFDKVQITEQKNREVNMEMASLDKDLTCELTDVVSLPEDSCPAVHGSDNIESNLLLDDEPFFVTPKKADSAVRCFIPSIVNEQTDIGCQTLPEPIAAETTALCTNRYDYNKLAQKTEKFYSELGNSVHVQTNISVSPRPALYLHDLETPGNFTGLVRGAVHELNHDGASVPGSQKKPSVVESDIEVIELLNRSTQLRCSLRISQDRTQSFQPLPPAKKRNSNSCRYRRYRPRTESWGKVLDNLDQANNVLISTMSGKFKNNGTHVSSDGQMHEMTTSDDYLRSLSAESCSDSQSEVASSSNTCKSISDTSLCCSKHFNQSQFQRRHLRRRSSTPKAKNVPVEATQVINFASVDDTLTTAQLQEMHDVDDSNKGVLTKAAFRTVYGGSDEQNQYAVKTASESERPENIQMSGANEQNDFKKSVKSVLEATLLENVNPDPVVLHRVRLIELVRVDEDDQRYNYIIQVRMFRRWQLYCKLHHERKLQNQCASRHYGNHVIHKAYNHWKSCYISVVVGEAADDLHRCHLLKRSFLALKDCVRLSLLKAEQEDEEYRLRLVEKCFKKWHAKAITRRLKIAKEVIQHWKKWTQKVIRKRLLREKAGWFIKKKLLLKWRKLLEQHSLEKAATLHHRLMVKHKSFMMWRVWISGQLLNAQNQQIALLHCETKTLQKYFNKMRNELDKGRKAKIHYRRKLLAGTLKMWNHNSQMSRATELQLSAKAIDFHHHTCLRQVIKKWKTHFYAKQAEKFHQLQNARHYYDVWCCKVKEKRQAKLIGLVLKVVRRWQAYVLIRQVECATAAEIIQRVWYRYLLGSWKSTAKRMREARTSILLRQREVVQRYWNIWSSSCERRRYNRLARNEWAQYCVRKYAMRWLLAIKRKRMEKVCSAAQVGGKSSLIKAMFQQWKTAASRHRLQLELGENAKKLLVRQRSRRMLQAWFLYTKQSSAIKPIFRKYTLREVSKAFDGWRQLTNRKNALNKILHYSNLATQRSAFKYWRTQYSNQKTAKCFLQHASNRCLSIVFEDFKAITLRKKAASDFRRTSLLSHTIHNWKLRFQYRLERREMKMVTRCRKTVVKCSCLKVWKKHADRQRETEEIASARLSEHRRMRYLKVYFRRWKCYELKAMIAKQFFSAITKQRLQHLLKSWHHYSQNSLTCSVNHLRDLLTSQSSSDEPPDCDHQNLVKSDFCPLNLMKNQNCNDFSRENEVAPNNANFEYRSHFLKDNSCRELEQIFNVHTRQTSDRHTHDDIKSLPFNDSINAGFRFTQSSIDTPSKLLFDTPERREEFPISHHKLTKDVIEEAIRRRITRSSKSSEMFIPNYQSLSTDSNVASVHDPLSSPSSGFHSKQGRNTGDGLSAKSQPTIVSNMSSDDDTLSDDEEFVTPDQSPPQNYSNMSFRLTQHAANLKSTSPYTVKNSPIGPILKQWPVQNQDNRAYSYYMASTDNKVIGNMPHRANQQDILFNAVLRWLNWPVSAAFNQWRELAHRQANLQKLMHQRNLSVANKYFIIWEQRTGHSLVARNCEVHAVEIKAFRAWRQFVHLKKRNALNGKKASLAYSENLCSHTFKLWKNKMQNHLILENQLIASSSHSLPSDIVHLLRISEAFQHRCGVRQLRSSFLFWKIRLEKNQSSKHHYNKLLVNRCFLGWLGFYERVKHLEEQYCRRHAFSTLQSCFNEWQNSTENMQRVRRFRNKNARMKILDALLSWKRWSTARQNEKKNCLKFVSGTNHHRCLSVFTQWKDQTEVLKLGDKYFTVGLKDRCFHGWLSVIRRQTLYNSNLENILQRRKLKLLTDCFKTWKNITYKHKQLRESELAHLNKVALRFGRKWKETASERTYLKAHERATQKNVITHWQKVVSYQQKIHRLVQQIAANWLRTVHRIRCLDARVTEYQTCRNFNLFKQAFCKWKADSYRLKTFTLKSQRRIFDGWFSFVNRKKQLNVLLNDYRLERSNKLLETSFGVWCSELRLLNIQREMIDHQTSKQNDSVLHEVLLAWHTITFESKFQCDEDRYIQTNILEAWNTFARAHYLREKLLMKFSINSNDRLLTRGFMSWYNTLNQLKVAKQHHSTALQQRTLLAWQESVLKRKQMIEDYTSRQQKDTLSCAWLRWKIVQQRDRDLNERAAKLQLHHEQELQLNFFETWLQQTYLALQAKEFQLKILRHYFDVWRSKVGLLNFHLPYLDRTSYYGTGQLLGGRLATELRQNLQDEVDHARCATHHFQRHLCKKIFNGWRLAIHQIREDNHRQFSLARKYGLLWWQRSTIRGYLHEKRCQQLMIWVWSKWRRQVIRERVSLTFYTRNRLSALSRSFHAWRKIVSKQRPFADDISLISSSESELAAALANMRTNMSPDSRTRTSRPERLLLTNVDDGNDSGFHTLHLHV